MKKIGSIVSVCFIVLSMIIYNLPKNKYQLDLIIAAVSMGGKYKIIGQDMLSGINLYLDQLNASGGINGRRVSLDIYDDKGDRNTAINVAMDIVKSNKALVVLGHYFSSTSLAASKVYLKSGIPAITGSATSEEITKKNDWYYSVAPNNCFQGKYIASYIRSSLNYQSCSVIYDTNDYGASLFKSFEEKARMLGLEIKNTWSFNKNHYSFESQINKIISQLRAISDPGIIFLATHAVEGARLIASLKYPGSKYKIFGPDSFSTNAFIQHLSRLPQEKASPGYYSDGIYTTTPFLAAFVNDQNHKFISDYVKKYMKSPTWVSACYYDATLMAIKAIQSIEGLETINHNRRMLRNALNAKYNLDTSEKGVCGPLFFDKDRNVKFPLRVSVYNNQNLVPDNTQYHLIASPLDDATAFNKILKNQLITSGEIVMDKTRIVFTGTHVHQIQNVDLHKGTYDMNFFLWFRYRGTFDDKAIEFLNAQRPIILNETFAEYKDGDITTSVYHIKETFSSLLDFRALPFETHDLSIQFRHKKQTIDRLVYIPDEINDNMYNKLLNINKKTALIKIPEWSVSNSSTYNGIISYESSLGIPVQFHIKRPIVYSTCAKNIKIKRDTSVFAIKILLPAGVLLLILVVASLLPLRHLYPFLILFSSVLLISSVFLFKSILFFKLQYVMFVQYVYFSLFIGSAIGLISMAFLLLIQKTNRQIKLLIIISRMIVFISIFSLFYYGVVLYHPTDLKRIIHIYTAPEKTMDMDGIR
ncbi:MAG: ABC transporter substrate-binding protein [Candidatus Magnetomorum sp.]|nr:ABC transporter substrate-binding protein [Candidatus Magnetomorum sp.]